MNNNKISEIFNLDGKNVVIVGGAGKMGLNFAKTLLNANCNVIISDVKNTNISELKNNLGLTSDGNYSFMPCDVNDVNQIKDLQMANQKLNETIVQTQTSLSDSN